MNILHISRTMGQGGAEKVVYQICKDINKHNMIIASTGGQYEKDLDSEGIKHYMIPDIDNKNPLKILKTYFILRKIIINEKIDVVHSHHRMAAFYSRILNLFHRKFKRIYTAHNVFYNKRKLLRFALKGSCIVAVGKGVKSNLVKEFGIDPNLIDIIYNSIEVPEKINEVNDDFFKSKKDKVFVGNIGRLSEQKGIDIFIKSMSNIIKDNNNVYGIIIGDGELKDELKDLSKELKIDNNIVFLGYRKDVLSLIKKMDFVVLSSRWEGFPLTPIEVFSQQKTIVASNIDGNNEIIRNNHNGILFEKDNVKELEEKIEELINTNKSELEKNAFDDYNKTFSYNNFIKNYINIYERISHEKVV